MIDQLINEELTRKYGRNFKAGDVIFQEGQEGDYMYIILSGAVKIFKTIKGKVEELSKLEKGEFFGETAITGKKPRSASAIATKDCLLLAINHEAFSEMLTKNQEVVMIILKKLAERIRQANLKIEKMIKEEKK